MGHEVLQRAGELWGRGFSVIPILERGKKPAITWADYQQRVPTMDELGDWFDNGRAFNIGIVTGAVSGIVVVDCDSQEAIAWADAHLPATPMRTKTAKGEHRFFQHPGVAVSNKARIRTPDGRLALDVRGDHGFVVGPGSVHETGAVYEKLGTWPAVEALPVFDPTWIAAPASITMRPNTVASDNRTQILTRARAYLAKVPPAIEGQGGDEHTFKAACKLVLGFALSDGDAFDLLRDWNQNCVPPWTDRELDAKIAAARKYGTEPLGARAADRKSSYEDLPGTRSADRGPAQQDTRPDILSEIAAVPSDLSSGRKKIRFRTAAELALEQPVATVWCVYGLLALGVITELAGKLKASGKTTFVAHAVRALLDGLPFLGHPTRKTAVVWLTEERPQTFLETLRRAHLETRADLHLLAWHDVKALPFPVVMQAAVARCKAVGADVLIIDTISQFAGLRGDAENNSGDALAAIEPLQMAAAEGIAVGVCRHERKGGGDVGESGRGSSAFSGAVDIVVVIRRGEGQAKPTVRVLHTLSRFSETPASLVMELTETGYVALGTAGTVAVLEAERTLLDHLPYGEAAALALDVALEGVTPRVVRTVAQDAVKNLMSIGQIQRVGLGRRGNGYRYFRTVEVSAGTQIT